MPSIGKRIAGMPFPIPGRGRRDVTGGLPSSTRGDLAMTHKTLALRSAALVLLSFTGIPAAGGPLALGFGVYTSDKPTDMYRSFKPILVILEDSLSKSLSRPVQIKLRVFNTYDAARKALVADEVDFVRFGPSSYILAKEENPGVQLIAIEEQEGSLSFRGVIFTRNDTGIRTLADLRGRSFAFGDPDSTIGRYLSQALLVEQGIHARDLSKFQYLGRHDRVVAAVLSRDFDAGACKDSSFLKARDQGLVELKDFPNVTKPWVVRSKLDPALVKEIRKALLQIKDKKALDAIGEKITGFAEAKDEMYQSVRDGMKASDEFEGRQRSPGPSGK
jgi:phosphonate transport system substrate-binding protein